jgi:hypothetical protein
MAVELVITETIGPPFEVWGTHEGRPWYFRIRSNGHWTFGLAEDPAMDPLLISSPAMGFFVSGVWGEDDWSKAGISVLRMHPDEVKRLIRHCLAKHRPTAAASQSLAADP